MSILSASACTAVNDDGLGFTLEAADNTSASIAVLEPPHASITGTDQLLQLEWSQYSNEPIPSLPDDRLAVIIVPGPDRTNTTIESVTIEDAAITVATSSQEVRNCTGTVAAILSSQVQLIFVDSQTAAEPTTANLEDAIRRGCD